MYQENGIAWPMHPYQFLGLGGTRVVIYILKFTNMVTIVDYRLNKNSDGEEFYSLILEGDLKQQGDLTKAY